MVLTHWSPAARGHLAMLTFSALVAGSFSFGSMIANKIDPVALMTARFMIAGSLIGAAAALTRGFRRSYFAAPWRYLVLAVLFALYFVLMFEGLKTAPPVSSAAVFTLTPIMSALFGWAFMRQKTTPRMALALAVGAVGALWVIFRADLSAALAFDVGRGEAVYFVGCVFHAAYTPLLKKLNRGEPALFFNFAVIVAMILLLCAYGWGDIAATDWAGLTTKDWSIVFYLAIFASAFTFVLIRFSSQHLPAAKVMAYTYLTPSWVIGWEIILGNGVPRGLILVGVAMTIVALWMLLKDES
ncbi:DMT family transporter [Actibacterium sp.]|uniref:DMT family transporter n=1 Tax=Actibacterium sp. TaxID=1872125 RepID=UPI00356461FE